MIPFAQRVHPNVDKTTSPISVTAKTYYTSADIPKMAPGGGGVASLCRQSTRACYLACNYAVHDISSSADEDEDGTFIWSASNNPTSETHLIGGPVL